MVRTVLVVLAAAANQQREVHLNPEALQACSTLFEVLLQELERYSGVENGESWSEGSLRDDAFLSSPGKGPHVLRVEAQWGPGIGRPRPGGVVATLSDELSHCQAQF